ncbi:hypothetical protein ACFFQW_01690 [Umezawaea endophytica]|uniref:Secreted protein n=1 Tax=Umezawaea endophytica TaxID=1654476 RepID=A0A9X2VHX2_9PSEU|nr:hypothetical protein [Umezawaea endophytica]MCS7476965.1 hypothetical protein [Umezawaea endophytica]
MMTTLFCVAGLTLTVGQAGAAAAKPLKTTFGTVLTKVDRSMATAALPDTIYCGGYVTNPYQAGGAVRVDIHGECTAVVDNIYLSPAIYYSNGVNVAERPANFPSRAAADHFAVTNCLGINLEYFGYGVAIFTKAGYAGSPLVLSGQTPNVTIFC